MSPFRLVYGKPCHLPVVLEHKAYWVVKKVNMEIESAMKYRMLQFNELKEIQNDAYQNVRIYETRTKSFHDNMIIQKNFVVG